MMLLLGHTDNSDLSFKMSKIARFSRKSPQLILEYQQGL